MGSKNNRNKILELAEKWREGVLTPEEKADLERWYDSFDVSGVELLEPEHVIGVRIFDRIERNIHPQKGFLEVKQTKL